jgi:hypothetical protein
MSIMPFPNLAGGLSVTPLSDCNPAPPPPIGVNAATTLALDPYTTTYPSLASPMDPCGGNCNCPSCGGGGNGGNGGGGCSGSGSGGTGGGGSGGSFARSPGSGPIPPGNILPQWCGSGGTANCDCLGNCCPPMCMCITAATGSNPIPPLPGLGVFLGTAPP